MIAMIIEDGKATLHELKTVYTMQDAYDLAEIIQTSRYNQWQAHKRASQGRNNVINIR